MPLILPGNVASATASTTYDVANSCRFNSADEPCLYKAFGTPTSVDKWTISYWVKRGAITGSSDDGVENVWGTISNDGTYNVDCRFNGSDDMRFTFWQGSATVAKLNTNAEFRDPSAWYHMVNVWDSGNATAGDRMKWYVNGVELTSFSTDTNPDQDLDSYWNSDGSIATVGSFRSPAGTGSGNGEGSSGDYYLAEFVFCDGQAYAASDFGEFNEDSPTIWQPKKVSGLTFGNNGFYLDFKASGNLGNDANGGTDLTEQNIAAADQSTDTPTNNFCVMNNLDNYYAGSAFSEGNCTIITTSSGYYYHTATVWLSAGKWYWEIKLTSGAGGEFQIGLANKTRTSESPLGAGLFNYEYQAETGKIQYNTGAGQTLSGSWGATAAAGDIIGVYLDLDNYKLYIAKDGVIMNSGTGYTITAPASTTQGWYTPALNYGNGSQSATFECNFGGCPAFALSSAVNDANGYGNFEFDPSDGGSSSFDSAAKDFLAICTKNLGSDGG